MASPYPNGSEQTFSTTEVAYHLQVTADTLRSWTRRFGRFLSVQAGGDDPRYTTSDVAALVMVQKQIEQGLNDEQVGERMTPKRIVRDETPSLAMNADQGRQIVDAKATLLRPTKPEQEDPNIAAAMAAASGKGAPPATLSDRLAALRLKQG